MIVINQYEIVLVNLDPTIGSEIKKTRLCVVISPNELNKYLQTIIIAPITSSTNAYPTRLGIKHKLVQGMIAIDQIRTIDKTRIIKYIDTLTSREIDKIKDIIQETFVD